MNSSQKALPDLISVGVSNNGVGEGDGDGERRKGKKQCCDLAARSGPGCIAEQVPTNL